MNKEIENNKTKERFRRLADEAAKFINDNTEDELEEDEFEADEAEETQEEELENSVSDVKYDD